MTKHEAEQFLKRNPKFADRLAKDPVDLKVLDCLYWFDAANEDDARTDICDVVRALERKP
jgi:hypothetical protein